MSKEDNPIAPKGVEQERAHSSVEDEPIQSEDPKRLKLEQSNTRVRGDGFEVWILLQLFATTRLFHLLDKRSILNLSLVCKDITKCIGTLISDDWEFNLSNPQTYENRKAPTYFTIKRATVNSLAQLQQPTLSHITRAKFIHPFNESVDSLPEQITHIDFIMDEDDSIIFNQPINNLPSNLVSLSLGDEFNQPIDNLPSSLAHLTIGHSFNHPVNCLPKNLVSLDIGGAFDQSIDELPPNLVKLHLGMRFSHPINSLPQNLSEFSMYSMFAPDFPEIDFTRFPPKLTTFEFPRVYKYPLTRLPPNLVSVQLPLVFNQPIDTLFRDSHKLEYIRFGDRFNCPVDGFLPPSLKKLVLSEDFNQSVNDLPKGLTHLSFETINLTNTAFNQPLNNLPSSLTHLTVGTGFNQLLTNLPPKLEYLAIGYAFKYLKESSPHLPATLKTLMVGNYDSTESWRAWMKSQGL
eukprot:TRINITY_DN699_c0_g1_i3.p1 TRINITY_DN699_c0_g1~~TRINITY_DN699_c0_g1_i3.p1  ORF type:complete len:462 (-),score=70.84 TRINITY_DN699_c0_g1_i3:216-1601(-)